MVMHLHGLTRFLRNMDITTLLINQTENITSLTQVTELGFSYLADNIIFFRYLEREGRFHKAIAVLKKRVSRFDNALHELVIGDNGIRIGPALSDAGTSSGGLE
jgi:circadian clock protein KaiC